MTDAPIYIYDGQCVLCSRAVQYVLRYEDRPEMRFVAIQSETGKELSKDNGVDPDNPDTFLLIIGDKVLKSSDALIALIRYAGGPARWLLILRLFPRPIRDFLYRRIAKNRYRIFGKYETCFVPDMAMRARFK